MSERLSVPFDVVERLENAGLDYMLSGSIVLGACGTPRMTRDVDDHGRHGRPIIDDELVQQTRLRRHVRTPVDGRL